MWLSVAMFIPRLFISATHCTGSGFAPGEWPSSQTEHKGLTIWTSFTLLSSWAAPGSRLLMSVKPCSHLPIPPISPVEISASFNTFFYVRTQIWPTVRLRLNQAMVCFKPK